MDILIRDNFFPDPDKLRKFGLNSPYHWSGNVNKKNHHWLGHRTTPSYLSSVDEINNPIIETVTRHYNFDVKDVDYTCSFHVSDLYNSCLEYFDDMKYHRDSTKRNSWAGLVYLTPNPPKKSGTSILDSKNSKFIEVENVYNRLVCYPARYIHAMTSPFGTNLNTGRMSLTFFFLGEEILKYTHIMR